MVKAIMDRVFIRLEPVKADGIIIPDDVKNPRNIGIVESVGEDVKSVKVGDKVVFHCFDELPTPDRDLVVVREFSLLGIIDD